MRRAPEAVGSGRANVTLHLMPCTTRDEKASSIQSIPAIQGATPDDGRLRPRTLSVFDVCYAPDSGGKADMARLPRWAISRHGEARGPALLFGRLRRTESSRLH